MSMGSLLRGATRRLRRIRRFFASQLLGTPLHRSTRPPSGYLPRSGSGRRRLGGGALTGVVCTTFSTDASRASAASPRRRFSSSGLHSPKYPAGSGSPRRISELTAPLPVVRLTSLHCGQTELPRKEVRAKGFDTAMCGPHSQLSNEERLGMYADLLRARRQQSSCSGTRTTWL